MKKNLALLIINLLLSSITYGQSDINQIELKSCWISSGTPITIEVDLQNKNSCIESIETAIEKENIDLNSSYQNNDESITVLELIETSCDKDIKKSEIVLQIEDKFFILQAKEQKLDKAHETTQTLDLQGNFMSSTGEDNSYSNTWDGKYDIKTIIKTPDVGDMSYSMGGRIQYIDTNQDKDSDGDWANELTGEIGFTKRKVHFFGNLKIDRDDPNNVDFRTNMLAGSGVAIFGKNYESENVFKVSIGIGPEGKINADSNQMIYDAVISEKAKLNLIHKKIKLSSSLVNNHSVKGVKENNNIKLITEVSAPLAQGISATLSYDISYNRDNDLLSKMFKMGVHCDIDKIQMQKLVPRLRSRN